MEGNGYGYRFTWQEQISSDSAHQGSLQWSPFTETTEYFCPSTKEFMINYCVNDLVALVKT
jgi:hypothetical protein